MASRQERWRLSRAAPLLFSERLRVCPAYVEERSRPAFARFNEQVEVLLLSLRPASHNEGMALQRRPEAKCWNPQSDILSGIDFDAPRETQSNFNCISVARDVSPGEASAHGLVVVDKMRELEKQHHREGNH